MGRKTTRTGRTKTQHSFFAAIELFLLATPAWRSLSLAARAAYIEVAALYNQSNNGRLALSARQLAERMPISRATATRAFQELTKKGFIVAAKPSGFNMKTGERRATEWRLTRYRCDVTGEIGTKAFMTWRPDQMIGEIHFAASPQGHRGFTAEPPEAENGQKSNVVALPRSRRVLLSKHDGFITGPLLDSTIGGGARGSAAAAPATQAASALPENQMDPTQALACALNS